jgi:hypothetical protein
LGCLADINGSNGPNAIVQFSLTSLQIWTQQSNVNCDSQPPTPTGSGVSLGVNITLRSSTRDYDGDGCTDAQELWAGKPGAPANCGDDPWNPYDSGPAAGTPDVSGSYDIVMERTRADVGTPGYYYECKADVQQSAKNLTARTLCYVDNPSVTVNPQVANGSPGAGVYTCPPANAKFCGDGLPGAAPPGCALPSGCATLAGQGAGCPSLPCNVSQYQFADIDNAQTVLTGTLDNTAHTMNLSGCFKDLDRFASRDNSAQQTNNIYVQAKINAYTGLGYGNLYLNQNPGGTDCGQNPPSGSATSVRIFAVRQAPGCKPGGPGPCTGTPGDRDSDGDGCPDKRELADTAGGVGTGGGLRDPMNRWDYFNPEKANTPQAQTVADILYVVGKYGKNQGNALYTIDADRTALIGGNTWNLGPPDGQQTVADILAAVKQYNQNC